MLIDFEITREHRNGTETRVVKQKRVTSSRGQNRVMGNLLDAELNRDDVVGASIDIISERCFL